MNQKILDKFKLTKLTPVQEIPSHSISWIGLEKTGKTYLLLTMPSTPTPDDPREGILFLNVDKSRDSSWKLNGKTVYCEEIMPVYVPHQPDESKEAYYMRCKAANQQEVNRMIELIHGANELNVKSIVIDGGTPLYKTLLTLAIFGKSSQIPQTAWGQIASEYELIIAALRQTHCFIGMSFDLQEVFGQPGVLAPAGHKRILNHLETNVVLSVVADQNDKNFIEGKIKNSALNLQINDTCIYSPSLSFASVTLAVNSKFNPLNLL